MAARAGELRAPLVVQIERVAVHREAARQEPQRRVGAEHRVAEQRLVARDPQQPLRSEAVPAVRAGQFLEQHDAARLRGDLVHGGGFPHVAFARRRHVTGPMPGADGAAFSVPLTR